MAVLALPLRNVIGHGQPWVKLKEKGSRIEDGRKVGRKIEGALTSTMC